MLNLKKIVAFNQTFILFTYERMEKRTDFYDFIEKIQRQDKYIEELEEENKKLREDYKVLGILNDEIRRVNENLREENKKLEEEVKDLVERNIELDKKYMLVLKTIKDHQLYEEKLEHRIIEFEELLHGD